MSWYDNARPGIRRIQNVVNDVEAVAHEAYRLLDSLREELDDLESNQVHDFLIDTGDARAAQVEAIKKVIQQLTGRPGMEAVVKALQDIIDGLQLEGSLKQASINPVTLKEEYSKELLISEAAHLMNQIACQWTDLVVEDISQTMIRASEYRDGKIHTGAVKWHITTGSIGMGIGRQVEIEMKVEDGFLVAPTTGRTPLGEIVSLDPIKFSNWVRLNVRSK